jgi:PAS domain S-box-containing protein
MPFLYNYWLVALSVAVAVMVSYTALKLATRVATQAGAASRIWTLVGAVAMGIGIWSMHFIGMLAFRLPIPLAYNIPTTLLSLGVAIVTSGFALHVTRGGALSRPRLANGALLMGAGICSMHYIGMAAVPIVPGIRYDWLWVALSVAIAVSASYAALWLLFALRGSDYPRVRLARAGAAVVMGLAICGMHYTGMAAAHFAPGSFCRGGTAIDNNWLAAIIGLFTLWLLATTLVMAVFDAHLQSKTHAEAVRLADSNTALQAEILERHGLQRKLSEERELLRTIIDLTPAAIYAKDVAGRYIECNEMVALELGSSFEQVIGKTDFDFLPEDLAQRRWDGEQRIIGSGMPMIDHEELTVDRLSGIARTVLTSKVPLRNSAGQSIGIVGSDRDITRLKEAERRSASADRLESLGQLSAGLAHEINTPVQYVNDSVYFIREGVSELLTYVEHSPQVVDAGGELPSDILELRQELPQALERVADGLTRIAEIVASMKDFSHPDHSEMGSIDLNRAIASTLIIARSEYKYVADVSTEFGDLPPVICHGSQVNQAILNLLINAGHAIADVTRGTGGKGLITIQTLVEAGDVVIRIIDTGGGIPDAIKDRIFEPFFTTKEVGRGTGQGLTLARNAIVQGHGGTLEFHSEAGRGTTFEIRLPIAGQAVPRQEANAA